MMIHIYTCNMESNKPIKIKVHEFAIFIRVYIGLYDYRQSLFWFVPFSWFKCKLSFVNFQIFTKTRFPTGDRSFDNTEGSSPFVSELMKELQGMKEQDDIYKVLTKVNNKVMRFEPGNVNSENIRQMPYFVSHLTKDLYLKQMV